MFLYLILLVILAKRVIEGTLNYICVGEKIALSKFSFDWLIPHVCLFSIFLLPTMFYSILYRKLQT